MRSAKTFLTKIDRSVGLADRDSAPRYELPRRLEAIDFGTPPPEVFAAHRSDAAPTDFVQCVFVTKCIVIALLYHCKTVLLYRSTLYIQNVMREETKVSVPIICVLHFCAVNVIFPRSNAASYRQHYPCVLLERSYLWTR
jgi:hypothetical protein